MRMQKNVIALTCAVLGGASLAASAETLTIATVNNGDMIRMQGLTDDFTEKTGHTVEWVTLEENVLRQRVTTDITTKGGAFDIMTIGMYETPIWGQNGWLVPLDDLSEEYAVDLSLLAVAGGLS
ncbi:MAG: extracellular solute-binding protein [Granulosicoccus sp.]